MARLTHFSKCHLGNVERGVRAATTAVVEAYLTVLGEDVNRRQLLMALLAGMGGASWPSTEVVARAFEVTLAASTLTVEDWFARLEGYGHDYMASLGTGEIRAQLAADLTHLQTRLDHPVLASVAAKLLTLHGCSVQSTVMPEGAESPALRWHLLGVRAADHSGDQTTRIWTRGRSALAMAFDGVHPDVATNFAEEALALSDRPSVGRLSASLAVALNQSRARDRSTTLSNLIEARRVFDAVGCDEAVSDFAFPEWRMELMTSLLACRLGDRRMAETAQQGVERTLPTTLPRLRTSLELHRGLLMARSGDRAAGREYAQQAMARLAPEGRRPSLRLLMAEVDA